VAGASFVSQHSSYGVPEWLTLDDAPQVKAILTARGVLTFFSAGLRTAVAVEPAFLFSCLRVLSAPSQAPVSAVCISLPEWITGSPYLPHGCIP
jgi:hypothetical protein